MSSRYAPHKLPVHRVPLLPAKCRHGAQAGKVRRQRMWTHVNARFVAAFLALYFCILAYAAWVSQQPVGTYTTKEHAKRVSLVFIAPALAYTLHTLLAWLRMLMDKKADRQIAALENRLRKTVTTVKDSMHYDATLRLLRQYDPDYKPPEVVSTPGKPRKGPPIGTSTRAANAAMGLAAQTVQGAGARMLPVVSQLWSHAANTLIGKAQPLCTDCVGVICTDKCALPCECAADDPVLLQLMSEAKHQAEVMQGEMAAARNYIGELERENRELRHRLGLDAELTAPQPEAEGSDEAWEKVGAVHEPKEEATEEDDQ